MGAVDPLLSGEDVVISTPMPSQGYFEVLGGCLYHFRAEKSVKIWVNYGRMSLLKNSQQISPGQSQDLLNGAGSRDLVESHTAAAGHECLQDVRLRGRFVFGDAHNPLQQAHDECLVVWFDHRLSKKVVDHTDDPRRALGCLKRRKFYILITGGDTVNQMNELLQLLTVNL